jgi:hypothetical protein
VFEIGTSLREARTRQQLEFPELERATKIRSKYLRALEDEQFDLLPAQTYVKGFLRTYAEYLGLDGQLYVDEYNSRYVPGDEESPFRPARISATGHERRVAARLVVGVLAGIAVVAALVIVAWKFGSSSGTEAQPPVAHHTKHRVKHQARRHTTAPTSVLLEVRATHGYGSYLQVNVGSSAGRQLWAGTLQPGQRQIFRSSKLWLRVDAPANVIVFVNKHRRALPGSGYPRTMVVSTSGRLQLASAA